MAQPTWRQIRENPKYQAATEEQKSNIRDDFFDTVVRPQVEEAFPEDKKKMGEVVTRFYDATVDDVFGPEVKIDPTENLPGTLQNPAFTPLLGAMKLMGVGDESKVFQKVKEIGEWEVGKQTAAFAVGMGAGQQDIIHGIQQIIGKNEDRIAEERALVNRLYESDEVGTAATAGQITGLLAEPIGALIPFAKGASLGKVAAMGAGVGGAYGSLFYVDEEAGGDRVTNAALGALTGGLLAPTMVGLGRYINRGVQNMENRAAQRVIDLFEAETIRSEQWYRHVYPTATGKPPLSKTAIRRAAIKRAKTNLSLSNDDIAQAILKSKTTRLNFEASHLHELERRVSGKLAQKIEEALSPVGSILTPVSTILRDKTPRLFQHTRKMEQRIHDRQRVLMHRVNPFLDHVDALPQATQVKLHRALLNGNRAEIKSIAGARKGMWDAYKDTSKVLDELFTDLNSVGYKVPKITTYFPRIVKDGKAIGQVEHKALKSAITAKASELKRDLDVKDLQKLIDETFFEKPTAGRTSGALLKRSIQEVDDELLPSYHNPRKSLHSYIAQNVADIEKRKMFGRLGHKRAPGKASVYGADLEEDIESILKREVEAGRLQGKDKEIIRRIFKARFGPGEKASAQPVQMFRNLAYMGTLGNFKSAMTQFGDIAISANNHGIRNTMKSLFGKKLVNKEWLGLDEVMEDMASTNGSKKVLDWALKYSGFKRIDKLGKDVAINAALKKHTKSVQSVKGQQKFVQEWGKFFEGDTVKLMDDLKNKRLTDNVKLLLWHELSDMQPIALSEMPLKYLEAPNGRIMYMLRTFTIRQLDIMRRQIWNELAAGKPFTAAKNAARYMALFVMANSTVDVAKDYLTGKTDPKFEDHLVDNMYALLGQSRYNVEAFKRNPSAVTLASGYLPPISILDNIIRAPDDPKQLLNLVPPFGRVLHGWMKNQDEEYFDMIDYESDSLLDMLGEKSE